MIFFEKDLDLIQRVTKLLNELSESDSSYYLHVELREDGSHRTVGTWCDEISGTDWYFEPGDDGVSDVTPATGGYGAKQAPA